ncbi:MAG: hypothetical protein J1E62_01090 [Lachnospiraceae bacterium]|nr:hypothetical protein [Lachnospiraceae bacterium]
MKDVQTQSFSLLSQEEIDILVTFLNSNKNSVNSDVMSQQSIDKLIHLITGDNHIMRDLFDPLIAVESSLLESMEFRKSTDELCELRCQIAEDTGYLKLTAFNTVTEKTVEITPQTLNEKDVTEWGKFIAPVIFNRLARALSLKYTTETHEEICAIFAKNAYGDENHPISVIDMPSNVYLLEVLI